MNSLCSPSDVRFSVYDNLLLVHCLPLATTTTYDLSLTPSKPRELHSLPSFPRVHHTTWLAAHQPSDAPGPSSPTSDEHVAPASAASEKAAGGKERKGTVAGASISESELQTFATAIPFTARFLAPTHVVDLESAIRFRYAAT
jgi:hypothetical protein